LRRIRLTWVFAVSLLITSRPAIRERPLAPAGIAVEEVRGDAGLHVDRRQRVRDDVVQVTHDSQPFLLGRSRSWPSVGVRTRRTDCRKRIYTITA
jgi:hypothetical protein